MCLQQVDLVTVRTQLGFQLSLQGSEVQGSENLKIKDYRSVKGEHAPQWRRAPASERIVRREKDIVDMGHADLNPQETCMLCR